jgi:ligand-binding sensor domain-containing protein/DNA-binding CsgD family transcriptional regulator
MNRYLLICFLCFLNNLSIAQIGVPQIDNYSNLVYNGGTQNWDIDQDKNGMMYFANNEGLLTYNGKYWHLYPLPNKTVVRSVKIAGDGKIYVGAQDEIGYFFPDVRGVLKYHSLKETIPIKERQFADVWDIVINQEEIYFRTTTKLLKLKDGAFTIYEANSSWEYLGYANGKVYAQDLATGLLVFKNDVWEMVASISDLKNNVITSLLSYTANNLLLTTLKNGLYILDGEKITKLNTSQDQEFINNRIYNAIKLDDNWFALASNAGGCYIIDKAGNVVQHFTNSNGLQKDNIRSIYKDKNQNLWLGLDNGIDFIAFNNAVKYIYPDRMKQTSGYATRILQNNLYIGTSNSVFYSPLNPDIKDISYAKNNFEEISNTKGQIWNLNIINKVLLVSHEDGAFIINNGSATKLYESKGTWLFDVLSPYYPSKDIVAGTYTGLRFINYENGKFQTKNDIGNINESLRFIQYDVNSNSIWASHPYRGVYQFSLSADKKRIEKNTLFLAKDGLPSDLGNYVFKVKNRIVIATIKGIYEFDETKKKFYPSKFLNPILGETPFQYLNEDKSGNIWFITYKKVGVVDFNRKDGNKDYSVVYFPELSSKVLPGYENIYPFNLENIFIGSDKGVIHINYLKYLKNIKPIKAILTQAKIFGIKDSILFGGYFLANNIISATQNEDEKVAIDKKYNSLHFEFSSTLYEQQNNIEFSYQLVGFDKKWSGWSPKSEKDYTNLPYGSYVFKVKARNNLGNESAPAKYTFTVNPAWYETFWVYILYVIIVIGIIYILAVWQKRKHEKEQAFLKNQYQLEIEHNENEIVKLQNEKLEAEVNFKNKELATATMHLVQRGKLLYKIKEELLPIVKTEDAENAPQEFKRILSLLNEAERADADWEQFAIHFDHVHSNFLSKLKEQVPSLSANDLKLCAYLKLNLSSKEMAQLMSITIRAVEVSRYRLRKKLNVSSDTNLFDYLIEITTQ